MLDRSAGEMGLPSVSVVTPSFNQGEYVSDTIESVLSQARPVEYVIIDGGSTDSAVEVIERYGEKLAFWSSEPDSGMYEAINKGFLHTSGDVMGWINSDDKYFPWTSGVVGEIFGRFPEIEWLTSLRPVTLDAAGRAVYAACTRGFSRGGFMRGEQVPLGDWFATAPICQEATFWRRSLWERAGGGVDASLQCAGDLELWARFFQHADLYGVTTPLAGARRGRLEQKSVRLSDVCREETMMVFERYGVRPRPRFTYRLFPGIARYVPPRVLRFTGVIEPTKVCTYRHGGWVVEADYTGIVR